MEQRCESCRYWKADYGTHCFNGWSGDGKDGWCQYEPKCISKRHDSFCHHYEADPK